MNQREQGRAQDVGTGISEPVPSAPPGPAPQGFSSQGAIPPVATTEPAVAAGDTASSRVFGVPGFGALTEDIVAFVSHPSGQTWMMQGARGRATPRDRDHLLDILRRFSDDLAPQREQFETLFSSMFSATPDADLRMMEGILGARFGLRTVDQERSLVEAFGTAGDAFDARELRRMWVTLSLLPPGHTEASASFRHLAAESDPSGGASGVYFGRRLYAESAPASPMDPLMQNRVHGSVSMDSSLADTEAYYGQLGADEQALIAQRSTMDPERYAFLEQSIAESRAAGSGAAIFDATLRHEIGHAVDEQLAASSSYCRTPAGGGWQVFGTDVDALISALVTAAGVRGAPSTDLQDQVRARITSGSAATGATATATLSAAEQSVLAQIFAMLDWGEAAEAGQRPRLDLGGRVFVTSNGSWVSYDRSARARQVSNYQFSAPAEWFAEAYQMYYDPAVARGERLTSAGDAATKQYFDTVVHPFVSTPAQPYGPS